MKISRMKTSRCLAVIIFCAVSASISFFIKADVFEDLFKNVDFEQLTKDMEKMLGDAEDSKEGLPKMPAVPSKEGVTGISGAAEKVTEPTGPKKDRRTLFLDPDMKKIEVKNKTTTEPTKESRKALSSFVKEMDKNLKNFENYIEANKKLSPQFKEKYLHEIRKKIDEIVVASELIDSKKIYQKIFLTPPVSASTRSASPQKSPTGFGSNMMMLQDSMKQLRQRYLSLIDELNSLNKKLEVSEEEESKEKDKAVLEELAGKEAELLPEYTALVPSKQKVRGAKPTPQTDQKKLKSIKKTHYSKTIKPQTSAEVQTGVQR